MPSRGPGQRGNEEVYLQYSLPSPRVSHRSTIGHVAPRRTSPQNAPAPAASPRFSPRSSAPACLGPQRPQRHVPHVVRTGQGTSSTPASPSPAVRRGAGIRVTSASAGDRRQAASPGPMVQTRLPSSPGSASAPLGSAGTTQSNTFSWMPQPTSVASQEGSRGFANQVQVQHPPSPGSVWPLPVQMMQIAPGTHPTMTTSRTTSIRASSRGQSREDDQESRRWDTGGTFNRAMHEAMRIRPPSPCTLSWVNDMETSCLTSEALQLQGLDILCGSTRVPMSPGTPQISGTPRTSLTPQISGAPFNPPSTPPVQTRLGGSLKVRAPDCRGGSLKLRTPDSVERNNSGEVCWELQGCRRTPVLDTRILVRPPNRVTAPTSRVDVRRSTGGNTSRSTSREVRGAPRSPSNSSRASSVRGSSRPGSLTTPQNSAETCWELQGSWRTQRPSAPTTQARPRGSTSRGGTPLSSSRASSRPGTPSATPSGTPAGRNRSTSPGGRTASVGTPLRLSGQPRQPRQGVPRQESTSPGPSRHGATRQTQRGSGKLSSSTGSGTERGALKFDEQEQLPPYAEGVIQQVQRMGAQKPSSNMSKPRPSRSMSPSNEVGELKLGVTCNIEDCVCEITDALGMGSFGTVWAAEDLKSGDKLAVKEIACWTHNELMNALFERHLLRVLSIGGSVPEGLDTLPPLSERPSTQAQGDAAAGSASTSVTVASATSSKADLSKIPSLVGHEVLCLKPKRVRLAMTRVPGIALEDFLEERRCRAVQDCAAGIVVKPKQRFSEACTYAHSLVGQLAPVFEQISALAIHRDVNTHNILIDAQNTSKPLYGLVDFGLAVDTLCWCSTENNPETKWRPTRIGVDAVHTWRYLDIAGDCRYWPVSAWTQFLIGWKEIDAHPSLRNEYQAQLDQHALGITTMKVFAELLSPPPPKSDPESPPQQSGSHSRSSLESSDIPNVQTEIWTLLRAWERYWKRITPVHKKLISTFHNGGDWDVLKQMCEDTNFYENIAYDLRKMREAVADAAEACRQAANTHEQGSNDSTSSEDAPMFAKAAKVFQALLLLISDGVTQDMLRGPEAWSACTRTLSRGTDLGGVMFDSHELPPGGCSSTASTAEVLADRQQELQGQKLATSLPS